MLLANIDLRVWERLWKVGAQACQVEPDMTFEPEMAYNQANSLNRI
jgi:hypothetical protein